MPDPSWPAGADPFVGRWELDPSSLRYEVGRPGRRATYVIEPTPEGLTFSLDGEDADGNRLAFTYGGALDGVDRELAPGVTLSLSRPEPRTVESVLKREGRIVDRWVRELQPGDSAILFTQLTVDAHGAPARNRSLYRRLS
jgi:hypothetical protein